MLAGSNIVLVATGNKGKVKEFAHRLGMLGIEVKSLADYPQLSEVVEDGSTFAENAEKKATEIARELRIPVLADDSGLCVDELAGAPGVFSARYAGERASDALNVQKLLRELNKLCPSPSADKPFLSRARFVCALALHNPVQGETLHVQGECDGFIVPQPRGHNGFGYDPVFYLPAYGKTMAELNLDEKHEISHRGKALEQLFAVLRQSDNLFEN